MNEAVKKNGLTFGVIIGVIAILIMTTIYSIDLHLLVNMWVGISIFFINIILGIVAVAKAKQGLGGLINFKQAFTTFFIAMAVGAAINAVFMIILFNVIDPGAKATVTDYAIEATVKMMKGFGTPTAGIKDTITKMREMDNFSIVNQLKSYVWGLLMYIVIGLIVAVALRNTTNDSMKA